MLNIKKFFCTVFILLGVLLLIACTDSESNDEQAEEPPAETVEDDIEESAPDDNDTEEAVAVVDDTATMQDRVGFDVIIPDEMNYIISMAPSITVTLIDLGLEDRIIAMDNQSELMLGEVDVPTFDILSPEIESMIALNPDFIFASAMMMMGDEENDPLDPLRELGIGVAYIPSSESIEGIKEDIRFIATVTDEIEAGEQLITEMELEVAEITALVAEVEEEPVVYFEISPAPDMFSFGSGVFLHEMIELVGATNVFADLESWLPVEAESIVSANPDVIFTNVNFIDDPVEEILSRPGWEHVDAVENERVYLLDNYDTSLPTHHIVRALRAMAEYLHGVN